jgi:hypothetical protein
MADSAPLGDEVAGAFARFFHAGAGPAHSAISRILVSSGYGDDYRFEPGTASPNKEQRVLTAFVRARRSQAGGRALVEGLLTQLRLDNLIGLPEPSRSEDEGRLRTASGARAGT